MSIHDTMMYIDKSCHDLSTIDPYALMLCVVITGVAGVIVCVCVCLHIR